MLAAAGSGRRSGGTPGAPPKQFLPLAGRDLYLWSLDVLLEAGCDPVVIAVPPDWVERCVRRVTDARVQVIAGGSSRQESVALALARLDTEMVVVHDAARPFITRELVLAVIDAAEGGAAIAAVPVEETLKQVVGEGSALSVRSTVDRSGMWRSQTPGVFSLTALKDAHERAAREGFVATDESQLIERYGGTVAVVPGSRTNLKLTWPEDVALAEAIAASREV